MTKIKNTKKGMAKKTLSMSLVVAMLATSNVPVWAAEFSDGSDAAVAAEAPTTETFSDENTDAPVVDDTTADTATAFAGRKRAVLRQLRLALPCGYRAQTAADRDRLPGAESAERAWTG